MRASMLRAVSMAALIFACRRCWMRSAVGA
jgi:hypothetical protein